MKEEIWSLFIIVLLGIIAFQVIGGMWNNTATYDEVPHLSAGYTYLKKADFRFNPEHPPFIKIISAIPLLFMKIPPIEENPHWNSKEEWQFGRYFLYNSKINADRVLFYGRLPMTILALLLAYFVFRWSKELYGIRAGVFSLFLFSFEPNFIASSQVIQTDLGFALFMTLSLYLFWKAMSNPSKSKFLLAGLVFGLALATKFTALILLPIYFGLIIFYLLEEDGTITFRRFRFRKEDRNALKSRLYFIIISFLPLLLIAFLVLIACYRFSAFNRYLDGIAYLIRHSQTGYHTFLLGKYSDFGWWYYFPLAFLIKTPLPIILFFILTLLLFLKEQVGAFIKKIFHQKITLNKPFRRKPSFYSELHILYPAFFLILFSLSSRINIGLRHIFPLYPLIIIFCGRFIYYLFPSSRAFRKNKDDHSKDIENKYSQKRFFDKILNRGRGFSRRGWLAFIMALMIWLVISSIFIFPHHISYFNEFVGGPSHGYKYLVDSNLDWGQDLIRLKKFLNKEGEDSVILSYFGSADPNYYGIKYQYLPGYGLNQPQDYEIKYNRKEFLAISATNLQSVYLKPHDTFDWLKKNKPYARVGYSIFIWEISKDVHAHKCLALVYSNFGLNNMALKHSQKAESLSYLTNPD